MDGSQPSGSCNPAAGCTGGDGGGRQLFLACTPAGCTEDGGGGQGGGQGGGGGWSGFSPAERGSAESACSGRDYLCANKTWIMVFHPVNLL